MCTIMKDVDNILSSEKTGYKMCGIPLLLKYTHMYIEERLEIRMLIEDDILYTFYCLKFLKL